MRFFISLTIGGFCMLLLHSCSTCSRQRTIEGITVDIADLAIDSAYVNMAQKVFYALPTPVEMSMLIKNMGIDYQPALLNDPAHASKYLTHRQMALNFGAYVTNLTYAGLFDQSQTVLRYQRAIRQLTEGLGLQSAIDVNTLQMLEENIHDKDAVLQIISETYSSCTATLNESDRYSLTLAMLIGGWVEGMHIATGMVNEQLVTNENRMRQLVIDQKLTFEMIWQAMSAHDDIPEVAALMDDLSGLAKVFDTIGVAHSSNEVTVAPDGKTSIIASTNTTVVSPETFAQIRDQIQILRQNFTKI
jgi:hypothetical protein